MNYQNKVREFQRASGQPVSDTPRELTREEFDFRDNLLQEEIRELREAIVDNNRVEILDALCDIKYVNDGTANMIGYKQYDRAYFGGYNSKPFGFDSFVEAADYYLNFVGFDFNDQAWSVDDFNHTVITLARCFGFTLENFKTALDRVHESNMSKFCYDTKTAERTQEFYAKQGINTYIAPVNKMTVVYREGDGKVLKSVDFWPPLLKDLI